MLFPVECVLVRQSLARMSAIPLFLILHRLYFDPVFNIGLQLQVRWGGASLGRRRYEGESGVLVHSILTLILLAFAGARKGSEPPDDRWVRLKGRYGFRNH